jgi:hypothetical protein
VARRARRAKRGRQGEGRRQHDSTGSGRGRVGRGAQRGRVGRGHEAPMERRKRRLRPEKVREGAEARCCLRPGKGCRLRSDDFGGILATGIMD